ncbi:transcriptional regulatory protein CseB [Marmoricola endophyticus]|uniref:Transcriptional regulatory protein CseB n=1 Tax=Marmoricola endophyticus TaxID=2040280 RepID=A0A917BI61_9ACTN|nr:response regulator transcription factor [Marmoricola endophyticus]GGF42272.1 transcriptional regulatory protein CseB [Marmoricola endophyticus]
MTQTGRLLLVEDDPVIGEATALHLERHGYTVTWSQDGLEAWESFADEAYDLVLSDVMLPGMDGVTLCRRVRESGPTPVVLISARSDSVDVVGGLEAGADDYVTKPFDVQVLLARLRSVLRRAEQPATGAESAGEESSAGVEEVGDLTVDRRAMEVRRDGEPVPLTPTELRLLIELIDARGAVLSRGQLLQRVWDYEDWEDDAHLVNVHVQRLRTKVGAELVETVRGFGYRLRT